MSFFFDNLWFWVALTFIVGAIGYFMYQNDPRGKTLGIVVTATLLVFGLGLALYYGVDTNRKTISRMLTGLSTELERDNLDGVLEYISPKAANTRGTARVYMGMFRLTSARFRNLKFEVNTLTSPPIARVSFLAIVYWNSKKPIDGFALDTPQFQTVKFDIELEKTNNNSWLVTDKYELDYRFKP